VALLSAPLLGAACTGMVNGNSGGNTGTPNDPSHPRDPGGSTGMGSTNGNAGNGSGPVTNGPAAQPGAGALSDNASVPGAAPVRRLTKREYDNTLRDLLGITMPASKATQVEDTESEAAGFVRGGAITGGDDVRNFMTASTQAFEGIAGKLGMLVPCAPLPTAAGEQEACAKKFIDQFGKRAFRRPLTEREATLALDLYKTQRGADVGASFEEAIGDLVTGFIQAPQFLYHWELGTANPIKDGNLIRYNDYEIASRLSYLFWATMPDDKLMAAADAKALSTPEQIAREAKRLLADARAKDGLQDFHLQWMEIGALTQIPKDDTVKDYSPAVAQSMLNETRDFVASVFQGDKATGKLEALLTSTHTVADASLGKIYGKTMTGTGAQPLDLDPTQRAGILTQLSFLTARADTGDSHPVKRGDTVLRRLFCMELAPPVNLMIPPVADAVPGGATTRQRFEMHRQPDCAACHNLLDPLGFAFENYDAIGAFRTKDQGKDVDTKGTVALPSGTNLTFRDAIDLSQQLAKLPEVQECVTTQWMRYMMGRHEVDGEKPSLAVVQKLFKDGSFDFRELLVGMTRTRSFTHRSASPGEVTQ
jgi:hypothetical protein